MAKGCVKPKPVEHHFGSVVVQTNVFMRLRTNERLRMRSTDGVLRMYPYSKGKPPIVTMAWYAEGVTVVFT